MIVGAVLERDLRFAPRSRGLFVARAVYAAALLAIIATCWLVVTGTQTVATAGDTARFGATLMRILGPLQLCLAMLAAALTGAVGVTTEKDRRTLELLRQLVREFGKTLVMVTHDPVAAQAGDRIVHIDKGRIQQGAGHA